MIGVKSNEKIKKTVNLDKNTIEKLEKFSERHGGLGLSATLRIIVNEFFLKLGGS